VEVPETPEQASLLGSSAPSAVDTSVVVAMPPDLNRQDRALMQAVGEAAADQQVQAILPLAMLHHEVVVVVLPCRVAAQKALLAQELAVPVE